MKLNYYIIASLPELHWEGEIKGTLAEFLDINEAVFLPYRPQINTILLYNEIRNIELLLRRRTDTESDYGDEFAPGILTEEDMAKFLEMPYVNQPEEYPDYMADFMVAHHEDSERIDSIEELYQQYYIDLKDSSEPFFRYFARTIHIVRTVVMAIRLQKAELPLEEHLSGDDEIVEIILDHRNTSDFGLKGTFPQIAELQALFEKPVLDLEKDLDLFIINLLKEYKEDDLFGDHVIYVYILSLFFRDRWALLDEEKGKRVVEEILQG